MSTDAFKVRKALNIEPIAGAAPTAEGDITYDATAHKASIHNGTSASPLVTEAHTQTLTNKTISGASNTLTNIPMSSAITGTVPVANGGTNSSTALNNNRVMQSSSGAVVEAAAITASKALVSDANGIPVASSVSTTTLEYLDATSSVQTQLDAKVAKTLTTTTGDMIYASSANTPARLAVGSAGQMLKVSGGVPTWAAAPSGGINYISPYHDAEVDTTGWALYEDAAATSPVNGTGVATSNEITWTRTTSTPLRGAGSFLLTKDAANRQGEGVSFDFTIDEADKGQVLQIEADYLVASGTYADNDLGVWIYDVTNSTLIQPAPYNIQNTSIAQKWRGTFQTATSSSSYRLIIHVASTSASAYTVKFDNFYVGPQLKSIGPAVTDWVSFTPTGGFITNTTYTGFWRRVGDTMEIRYKLYFAGAPNSTNCTLNLPSGYTIDTAKLASTVVYNTNFGMGTLSGTYNLEAIYSSTTAVVLAYQSNASGIMSLVTQAAPNTIANTNEINATIKVPITGWSSGLLLGSDADTRVVAATYSIASSNYAATANNPVNFETKLIDTHGAVTTGSGWKFTAPVPGVYNIQVNSAITSGSCNIALYKNGVSQYVLASMLTSVLGASGSIQLAAGDYIQVVTDQTKTYTGSSNSVVSIFKLSGPSQIAASESVNARMYLSANQTGVGTNNSYVKVNLNTVDYSSHGSGSGALADNSNYKFVAQISGTYRVTASLIISANVLINSRYALVIYKNGSSHDFLGGITAYANSIYVEPTASATLKLLAGDYVELYVYGSGNNSSSTLTLNGGSNGTNMDIVRVGNY